jgi:hypothetical protein
MTSDRARVEDVLALLDERIVSTDEDGACLKKAREILTRGMETTPVKPSAGWRPAEGLEPGCASRKNGANCYLRAGHKPLHRNRCEEWGDWESDQAIAMTKAAMDADFIGPGPTGPAPAVLRDREKTFDPGRGGDR